MNYVEPRPYAKPEAAAVLLLEIAKTIGADRRGMIPVGAWNATFINTYKGSSAKHGLGRDHLISVGIIAMDGSAGFITWEPTARLRIKRR